MFAIGTEVIIQLQQKRLLRYHMTLSLSQQMRASFHADRMKPLFLTKNWCHMLTTKHEFHFVRKRLNLYNFRA